jgi:putative ABC transport system permease protein
MPQDYRLVAGRWWPADYRGEPAISLDARIAAGMGLGIGDTLTVNVLGRDISARIMSLREVNWQSLGLNFTIVFAPGVLEGAPHTFIATAYADRAAEETLFRVVSDRFSNVTAIKVRDALDAVASLVNEIAVAIRATAAVTLVAGLLVLASAVATGRQHRVRDAVILKVLGATRRNVLGAFLIEYGLIGALTAAVAAVAGTAASWAVVALVMRTPWTFFAGPTVQIAGVSLAATLAFGFAGTFQALGRKAGPYLRNP